MLLSSLETHEGITGHSNPKQTVIHVGLCVYYLAIVHFYNTLNRYGIAGLQSRRRFRFPDDSCSVPGSTTFSNYTLSLNTNFIYQTTTICLNINQQLFLFSFAAQLTSEVIVLLVFCHDVQFLLFFLPRFWLDVQESATQLGTNPKVVFFNIYIIYICTLTCKSICRKQGSGAACFCKRTPKGIVREDILFRESKD